LYVEGRQESFVHVLVDVGRQVRLAKDVASADRRGQPTDHQHEDRQRDEDADATPPRFASLIFEHSTQSRKAVRPTSTY